MFGRQKLATLVAEFLGAGALTLLVLTVQRSSIGVPFFIAAAAGLTFALMTFAVGNTSGGYFNPALTLGLWTARKIETLTAILYVGFQLLGGWAAGLLYSYMVNNSLQTITGHFSWRIFTAEAVGAGLFAFVFASGLYQRVNDGLRAAFTGVGYMVGILAASSASLALINPATALGIKSWVWTTYVLGPVVGAVIGVNLYATMFAGKKLAAVSALTAASAASAGKSKSSKKK